MAEQYANFGQTTLNGAINNAVTSLVLTSATGFPASGDFRIVIDSEIILVGARSGTTCSSLTRGHEGTSAASHADLATVSHVVTAGGLTAGIDERVATHTGDTSDAHDASAISFTPNGSIASTDVQAAIQEVRDEATGGSTNFLGITKWGVD